MSEATEQIISHRSPLHEIHVQLGAKIEERDEWLVPASYGDELFEYAAVRENGAGLIDLSSRARFHVSGSEAQQFLNGLITNDMKSLEESRWMPAAFPNVQGRLIASVRVGRVNDDYLIDTEAATRERVLQSIQRFTLAGDFHVKELTDQQALVSVQGKQAAEIMCKIFGKPAARIPQHRLAQAEWKQQKVTLWRASHTAEDGFDLLVDAGSARDLWESLQTAGARPVGFEALEMLRIEAGRPRYGVDMDETSVVPEVLEDAVSYTKGCYVGQEIIARIKYRGHVAKKLTGLTFNNLITLDQNAKVMSVEGKEIGRITSVTMSPYLGRTIALASIKYDYVGAGTEVAVSTGDGDLTARVTELPFVRGSWA